ncbi:MAG: hypothetical protein U0835_06550 [Isosphaeraceae bacterium]
MTKSSGKPPSQDMNFVVPQGMTVEPVTFKPLEDQKERDQRLRKDFLSFVVKDLLATTVAIAILLAAAVVAFALLLRSSSTVEEKRFAITILSSILSALVGFVFGKAVK